jgi:hypothetical protein
MVFFYSQLRSKFNCRFLRDISVFSRLQYIVITGTFPADIFLGMRASPKGVARGACPIVSKGLSSLKFFLNYSF